MDKLAKYLDSICKSRFEEDFVDRLNYRITSYILLTASIFLSAKSYVGKPLQCWVPENFQYGWEEYVENYCFVENTYWVPMEDELPSNTDERDRLQLSYYQWVPFVLALQALMFNIPYIVWRMLNWLSGIEVRAIITMASDRGEVDGEAKQKMIDMIALHLKSGLTLCAHESLSTSSNPFAWIARWTSSLIGAYITITYLMVKILFIVNCFLQFILLNAFLDTKLNYWGAEILSNLITGKDWSQSGHFPRVTMCDFEVRQMGNLNRWSVQCVLMINMFSEKIFLFLWWWFLAITIVTILNFIYWLVASSISAFRKEFLERMLISSDIFLKSSEERKLFDQFANRFVRSDGVLVLRLLARNAGEIVGSRVVVALWNLCQEDLKKQSRPHQASLSMEEEKEMRKKL